MTAIQQTTKVTYPKKQIRWNSKKFHSPVCKFIQKHLWRMMLCQIY